MVYIKLYVPSSARGKPEAIPVLQEEAASRKQFHWLERGAMFQEEIQREILLLICMIIFHIFCHYNIQLFDGIIYLANLIHLFAILFTLLIAFAKGDFQIS